MLYVVTHFIHTKCFITIIRQFSWQLRTSYIYCLSPCRPSRYLFTADIDFLPQQVVAGEQGHTVVAWNDGILTEHVELHWPILNLKLYSGHMNVVISGMFLFEINRICIITHSYDYLTIISMFDTEVLWIAHKQAEFLSEIWGMYDISDLYKFKNYWYSRLISMHPSTLYWTQQLFHKFM